METDSLFYRLFKEKPTLLFELLGEKSPKVTYTFSTYEVKQTNLRGDGLLKPLRSTQSPLIFLENQAYSDQRNEFYASFFTKIFHYLRDYKPKNDWRAVVLFTQRKFDPGLSIHYQEFVGGRRLQRIYLDELPPAMAELSLEMSVLQLIGLERSAVVDRARTILRQTYQQTADAAEQRRALEWILTVFAHKFSKLSREEVAEMLGITKELRESRFYQDIKEEGREEGREAGKEEVLLQTIPLLLQAGIAVEEIADRLKITIAQVQKFAR